MQLVYFSVPAQIRWLEYVLGGARGKEGEKELQEEKENKIVRQASKFCHCPVVHASGIHMANSMPAKLHGLPKTYSAWTV